MEDERKLARRIYSEKWKAANYEYYRNQKNALGRRDSYKARRRLKYGVARDRLRDSADYVPPTRGRPRIYSPREALQRKRGSARSWARARRVAAHMEEEERKFKLERDEQGFLPGFLEAQTRLRTSYACKEMVWPLSTPLDERIVAMAGIVDRQRRARRVDQKISGKDKSQQDDDSGTTPSEKSH